MRSSIGRIRPTGGYHIARTLQNAQPSEANKLINERDIPAITAPSWSNTSTFRLCKTSIFSTFTSQVWINYVIDFRSLSNVHLIRSDKCYRSTCSAGSSSATRTPIRWYPPPPSRPHPYRAVSYSSVAWALPSLCDIMPPGPWRVTTLALVLSYALVLHYSLTLIHILKNASSFNVASTLVWLKPTLNWRRTLLTFLSY